MARVDPRKNKVYRRMAARLAARTKARGDVCWICGEPFDWSLPWQDARAFTADHVIPLARGGSVTGALRPAHRGCNSHRGDGTHEQRFPTPQRW